MFPVLTTALSTTHPAKLGTKLFITHASLILIYTKEMRRYDNDENALPF